MCNQPQFGVVTHVHVYCSVTGERKTMHPQTEILTLPKTQQKQPLHVPVYITDTDLYVCECVCVVKFNEEYYVQYEHNTYTPWPRQVGHRGWTEVGKRR